MNQRLLPEFVHQQSLATQEDPEMSAKLEDKVRQSIDEMLEKLPPEKRLEGLSPEECLKGLSPDQRLKGLSPEELQAALDGLSLDQR